MPYNIHGCLPSFHIHNDLPQNTPQLEFHCASGDDDLHWSFCATPATLFFCHFWWNEKDLAFDVFNQITGCVTDGSVPDYVVNCHWQVKADENVFDVFNDAHYCIHGGYKFVPYDTNKCIYGVQEDGFYFGTENFMGKQNLTKYADWLSS
ncbi:hypothetical protein H5410_048817 [Solanum commersonii]|uniref:S-protein homolog n=1 Tax=Solanum commersonii TaxID=4109 RepID=A0A9J5XLM0_SOLCO|nr:hypothetical protein H5410_048817 [Solanum commersonii]